MWLVIAVRISMAWQVDYVKVLADAVQLRAWYIEYCRIHGVPLSRNGQIVQKIQWVCSGFQYPRVSVQSIRRAGVSVPRTQERSFESQLIYLKHCRPETCPNIKKFAENKGVEFTMMDKIDVNGLDAHNVYHFLKKVAGPPSIGWNFATYYVVTPDGTVQSFTGVDPMDLVTPILEAMGINSSEL